MAQFSSGPAVAKSGQKKDRKDEFLELIREGMRLQMEMAERRAERMDRLLHSHICQGQLADTFGSLATFLSDTVGNLHVL